MVSVRLSQSLIARSSFKTQSLLLSRSSPAFSFSFPAKVRQRDISLSFPSQSTPSPSLLASIPPPLQGLKVVDLTRVLAGPYCTMLLADLGADVIKIEHPKNGDDTRSWSPPFAPNTKEVKAPAGKEDYWNELPPESAYFLSVNRNKRSITVDLKSPKGREIVHKLVKEADIVVENYLPGKLKAVGLGYDDLKKIKPDLIYASITGYGQTGPYGNAAGYDVIIAADAGLFHITGEADRPPVKIGVAMTDLTTGLYVHGAIMAALIGRSKTGKGVHIDASLFESQIASLANIGSNYLIAGKEATRQGTAHPSIVPYQVFPTKDGFLMVGAGNDGQFKTLSTLLGRPELSSSDLYSSNALRVKNRETLIPILNELFQTKESQQWLDAIGGKIPAAPIRNIEGTFSHPQAISRGVISEIDHPRAGKIKIASPAIRYGEGKMPISRPPPVLGQHTDEVLKELGYSEKDVGELRNEGTIGR